MRWFTLSLLLLSSVALADDAAQQANELLKSMEYGKALDKAEEILRLPTANPEDLVAAYRIQGLCLSAMNRQQEAVETFRRLLAIDAHFRLSKNISPKLRDPFYKAVGMSVDQEPITIEHQRPDPGAKLGGLKLRARLKSDPMGMARGIRFRYQVAEDGEVRELAVLVQGPKTISLKLPDGFQAEIFQYWVEAFNEHGGTLARLGSREKPFVLKVRRPKPAVARIDTTLPAALPKPEPAQPPAAVGSPDGSAVAAWYESWWFWTVVGVVAAGAVTGGVLAGTSGGSPSPLHWNVEIQ